MLKAYHLAALLLLLSFAGCQSTGSKAEFDIKDLTIIEEFMQAIYEPSLTSYSVTIDPSFGGHSVDKATRSAKILEFTNHLSALRDKTGDIAFTLTITKDEHQQHRSYLRGVFRRKTGSIAFQSQDYKDSESDTLSLYLAYWTDGTRLIVADIESHFWLEKGTGVFRFAELGLPIP